MARIVLLSSLFSVLMVLASAASLVSYGTDEGPTPVDGEDPPALPVPLNVSSHQDLLDPRDSADAHHYHFNLTDSSGNWDRTPTVQDYVTDIDLPVFTEDLSDAEATTGDPFTFSVNVTDNTAIALALVLVNYSFDRGPYFSMTMNWDDPTDPYWGVFNLSVPMPKDTLSLVSYYFTMKDEDDNWNTSSTYTRTVVDNDAPLLLPDPRPMMPTTGDTYTFELEVEDNIMVASVRVVYWFEGGPTVNETMDGVSLDANGNGTYEHTDLVMPSTSLPVLNYYFIANDTAGNWDLTNTTSFNTTDNDGVMLVTDLSDTSAYTGNAFTFSVNLADNIGIDSVIVSYRFGLGAWTNWSMVGPTNAIPPFNYIYLNLTVPLDSLVDLRYIIRMLDVSDNWNLTSEMVVPVIDDDPALIGRDLSDTQATTGDPFAFLINVTDNIRVEMVRVQFWQGGVTPKVLTMDPQEVDEGRNGLYRLSVNVSEVDDRDLEYRFLVLDTFGNLNSTQTVSVPVADNDAPTMEDLSDDVATTGETFHLEAEVADNIGIAYVWVTYTFASAGLDQVNVSMEPQGVDGRGNGSYVLDLAMPNDMVDRIIFNIYAFDTSGNWFNTVIRSIDIIDNDRPIFVKDDTPGEAMKGLDLTFSTLVWDNVSLARVHVVYQLDGEGGNLTMAKATLHKAILPVPRDAVGPITYHLEAVDTAGNWNRTEDREVPLVNAPPVVAPLPTWTVVEEDNGTLDLTSYLSDLNDPLGSLEVTCDDPAVTVDRLTLTAYFEAWTAQQVVAITVSDGEASVEVNIDLEVVNVNDPPVITSMPSREGEVGTFYSYQVEFTDEDLMDAHTFEFVTSPEGMTNVHGLISWTPSRDQHDFHTVLISLSDGSMETWHTWTVHVVVVDPEPNNLPPVFTSQPHRAAHPRVLYQYDVDAADPDGDRLYYHITEGPGNAVIDNLTGEIDWIPQYENVATSELIPFTIMVSDGFHQVEQSFEVRLRFPANAAPEIRGKIPDVTTSGEHTVDLKGYMSDTDDDVADLTWRVVGDGEDLFEVTVEGNKLKIVPREGASGKATVTLVLEDLSGSFDAQDVEVELAPWYAQNYWVPLLLIALVVIIVAVIVVSRRRRTPAPAEPPVEEETPEDEEEVVEDASEDEDLEDEEVLGEEDLAEESHLADEILNDLEEEGAPVDEEEQVPEDEGEVTPDKEELEG